MGKKDKKIGITYYLNDRVNPTVENGEERYPVYCRITYDRMNHQFAFSGLISQGRWFTRQEFHDFFEDRKDGLINADIEMIEVTIRDAIRIEAKHYGEKYSLKGFSNNLYHYGKHFYNYLDRSLRDKLFSDFKDVIYAKIGMEVSPTYFSFWELLDILSDGKPEDFIPELELDFQLQMKGYLYLSPFLKHFKEDQDKAEQTAIYDWFEGDIQPAFKAFLLECSKANSKEEKRALSLFEKEAKDSIVLKTYFFFDLTKFDIPLIMNVLSNVLIR